MRSHCTFKLILLTSFSSVMYFFLFLKSTTYALFGIILPCISQEKKFPAFWTHTWLAAMVILFPKYRGTEGFYQS